MKNIKQAPFTDYPCMRAKSLQSCPTLCDPIDGSPPGSSVPGILQAGILEWVAISFSNACMHAKSLQLCPTLCDPLDSSPPGSSVHRILQARTLEWVAISFSTLITLDCALEGFPGGASGKEATCQCRRPKTCGFNPWVRKIL